MEGPNLYFEHRIQEIDKIQKLDVDEIKTILKQLAHNDFLIGESLKNAAKEIKENRDPLIGIADT